MAITKLNSLAIPPDTVVESDISFPLDSASFTGDLTVDTDTLVVDSTDDLVGINTSTISAPLHVQATTEPDDTFKLNDSSGNHVMSIGHNGQPYMVGAASKQLKLGANNSGHMTFHTDGNVAIGDDDPVARLQVSAGGQANSPTLGSIDANAPLYVTNSDHAYGLVAGVNAADGRVWMQSQRTDDTATAYNITFNEAGGNVGIAVTDPDEKLEIGGDIKVNANGSAGVIHFGPTSDLTKIIGRDENDPSHPKTLDFCVDSTTVSRLSARNASFGAPYTINGAVDTSYAVMTGAGYGAIMSGDDGGRGLFGTNVTTTNGNVPVIANSHGGYGGIGLSFSWGVATIVRKGGAVTAGDTLDTVVRFDHDGLKFGGDTASANALDDYEEGTFTPDLNYGGSSAGQVMSVANGSYTKIGRVVHCNIHLHQTTKGTGTGYVTVSLPFHLAIGNHLPNTSLEASGSIGYHYGSDFSDGLGVTAWTGAGLRFYKMDANGYLDTNVMASDISNDWRIRLSITYLTT